MSLSWSEVGSVQAGDCLLKVSAGASEDAEADRVGITFAGKNMTSYIEVDSAQLQEVIELLRQAERNGISELG